MEDHRDHFESSWARSGFKGAHSRDWKKTKIHGKFFRSQRSYFVKKLRWTFRERKRITLECLDWDVADLLRRLAPRSVAEMQDRLRDEEGKRHPRHMLMINTWQFLFDPAGSIYDSPSGSVVPSVCLSICAHPGCLPILWTTFLKKPACSYASNHQSLALI